ncbi:GNAT family N-acetyltransferase [Enterococcus plantarum]|uniref:GNAT family N-acetyltransferase n=1 Tax=Enterococcus plantarum TaxID=1077675 RepID=UPI001A8DF73E|nr:GNAT family N-acetyltransferase [Enterococcus plantarum]MBO0468686.1 GNAT family N-acetyltransferase [Enterococcus plantarum]
MNVQSKNNQEIKKVLENKISKYNNGFVSNQTKNIPSGELCYISRNDSGFIQAGIAINWYWGIMHIDHLWVNGSQRGKKIGEQLLKLVEEKAISLGCTVIHLETYSFQAPNYYKKFSYEVFGTLENVPEEGISLFYMRKKL